MVARVFALTLIAAALMLGVASSALSAGVGKGHPKPGDDRQVVQGHDGDDDDDEDADDEGENGGGGASGIRLQRAPIAGLGAPKVRYVPGQLVVRFRPGTSSAEMEAAASRAGGRLTRHIPELDLHVVKVPPARTAKALASLRSEPSVESVERDVLVQALDTVPDDPLWSTQWGSRLVGAPRAWDATRGADAIVIAILDTGVDAAHQDLGGATVPGRDFVNGDLDPTDDQGHGTAVAGVIAARTNNLVGAAGVCWTCSMMPVKVLDSTGSGATSTIATGIVWAIDHGARVLNMSFGSPGKSSTMQSAISYASKKGAVLAAAAGNSGVDTPFYPAAYSNVIGVSATNEADARYSWSNYGDWVQVAAPGCNTAPNLGGGYVEFCGTSSATPIVAGIAGLALSLNPAATESDVEQAIAQSATPVPGAARYGRVNAPSVMSAVSGSSIPLAPPTSSPPQPSAAPAAPAASQPPAAPAPRASVPRRAAAPANVKRPRLAGRARVGRILRVSRGIWSPAPARFAYQWRRCGPRGANCRTIAGARSQSYRLKPRDRGHRLRAVVVALDRAGTVRAQTGASAVVRATARRR